MNKITSNELIYYTASKDKKMDFSGGESSLSLDERFDFLKHYFKEAAKWYGDSELKGKAVDENEVSAFINNYTIAKPKLRGEIRFDNMSAYSADKGCEYENFQLYCGARIDGEEIIFADRQIRPTPCAKYIPDKPSEDIKFGFDIYISKEFDCHQEKKSGTAQAARTVELRVGTLDKVKIKFYNTGEVIAFSEDMWVPKFTYLPRFKFDTYNHIEITVAGAEVKISVNGCITENIKITAKGKIDNIFFEGGMHARGLWKLKALSINDDMIELKVQTPKAEELQYLGDVSLPYAIGTYKNKDKRLYLFKKFTVENADDAVLDIESLDPCGKVWLNDSLVLDTDDFTKHRVNVTSALRNGENELKIMVEPRPPEVYYYWHRHSDCYNGWFCGEVVLSYGKKLYIDDIRVDTLSVENGVSGKITVKLNESFKGTAQFFLAKIHPEADDETELGKTGADGNIISFDFCRDLELWSTDTPNLYAVRVCLKDNDGCGLDDCITETGFRIIEQKNGSVYLNGTKTLLNGALLMQFLPPLENVPVNHNCPTLYEIISQAMMLKNMNGNLLRLHLLGYGTNDARFARVCDRLGLMLIWTTRFIDSIETLVWDGAWREAEAYQKQMLELINHPSIIMWEGSNEYHFKSIEVIDRVYAEYVSKIKEIDTSRLICPSSHLYYGSDIGCQYYNEDGTEDVYGNKVKAGKGWRDKSVIRSAHTYAMLCGYGIPWENMRKQTWCTGGLDVQDGMLNSREHSYHITEFAITALANPNTKEARENEYVDSYERVDEEGVFGRRFEQSEWDISQAYQALCTQNAVKLMRSKGIDGMLWCCLTSGANNGSYMKPPIDFYGYKKLGFYALKEGYSPVYASKGDVYVSYGTGDSIEPVILNSSTDGEYNLKISIISDKGDITDTRSYTGIRLTSEDHSIKLDSFKPKWDMEGYYTIKFELEKVNGL